MHGDTARRSLNGGVTVAAASQYTSVDVTALAPAAAAGSAVDKRREASVTTTTKTDIPVQCISLDELAPVLEDPTDNN